MDVWGFNFLFHRLLLKKIKQILQGLFEMKTSSMADCKIHVKLNTRKNTIKIMSLENYISMIYVTKRPRIFCVFFFAFMPDY